MRQTTITLPVERAQQLRALAGEDGSLTELIERLINQEIAAGRLTDSIPGFDVEVADKHVWIAIGDFGFPALAPAHARTIADLLEFAGTEMKVGRGVPMTLGTEGAQVIFKAGRHGRGVVIAGEDVETGHKAQASMTPGMARDLARVIRKAADKAQRQKPAK